jgi:hypothetical protein
VTVGLPGSGLSWTETLPHGRRQRPGGAVAFIARLLAMLLGLAIGFGLLALFAAYG